VRGDKPEGVAVQAVPDRDVPCQPGAAGRSSPAGRTRAAQPLREGEADQPVAARSSVVMTRYFRERISRFYRDRAPGVNVGSATSCRAAHLNGRYRRPAATSPPLRKRSIWLRPRNPHPETAGPGARSAWGFHWHGVSVMDSSGSSGHFPAIVVPWSRSAAPWPALNADCTGTQARSRPGAATAITSIACSRFTVTWTRLRCLEARGLRRRPLIRLPRTCALASRTMAFISTPDGSRHGITATSAGRTSACRLMPALLPGRSVRF